MHKSLTCRRIVTAALVAALTLIVAGAAFAMTTKPTIASFSPASGVAGTKVTVTGKNLSGVSAVKLGSLKAAFAAGSATKIIVTVPSKAKSGKISITTKGGTATSSKTFKV